MPPRWGLPVSGAGRFYKDSAPTELALTFQSHSPQSFHWLGRRESASLESINTNRERDTGHASASFGRKVPTVTQLALGGTEMKHRVIHPRGRENARPLPLHPMKTRNHGASEPRDSVLDCGSPLPLSLPTVMRLRIEFRPSSISRPRPKRQRTGALHDAGATTGPATTLN